MGPRVRGDERNFSVIQWNHESPHLAAPLAVPLLRSAGMSGINWGRRLLLLLQHQLALLLELAFDLAGHEAEEAGQEDLDGDGVVEHV